MNVGALAAAAVGPASEPILSVSGLVHRFDDQLVVDGAAFRVERGEVFGLLGPNGSGKSTVLKVLCGLILPTAGDIKLDETSISAGDRRLRARMGVVFQEPSLDPRMTARENLRMMARLHGVSRTEADRRTQQLLALSKLEKRADEPVRNLSGGMRRSVEIARALVHHPDILLLDEPTTGVDQSVFETLWGHLSRIRRERELTILVTTHRPEEAERCDRIAILQGGRVARVGSPDELKAQVSGDIVTLEAEDTHLLSTEITERFGVAARIVDGRVVVELEQGHRMIPRIVEELGPGRLTSLSMHRPTLADVFTKITGESLLPGGMEEEV